MLKPMTVVMKASMMFEPVLNGFALNPPGIWAAWGGSGGGGGWGGALDVKTALLAFLPSFVGCSDSLLVRSNVVGPAASRDC